jgi:hypothetical protein
MRNQPLFPEGAGLWPSFFCGAAQQSSRAWRDFSAKVLRKLYDVFAMARVEYDSVTAARKCCGDFVAAV